MQAESIMILRLIRPKNLQSPMCQFLEKIFIFRYRPVEDLNCCMHVTSLSVSPDLLGLFFSLPDVTVINREWLDPPYKTKTN